MKYPPVTVACLIYKSPDWLSFLLEGLAWAKTRVPYRTLIVGNDAEPQVMETGRVDIDFRNADPSEYYINRVYRAWNKAVESAETDLVCLINSDMYVSDYWLDALVEAYADNDGRTLPTSLLVESGRIPSAMPEYVADLGLTPESFDRARWSVLASSHRSRGVEPGRLFMPVLFNRNRFLRLMGYPCGNPRGTSGDLELFTRFQEDGLDWVTCLGSVVYHCQEGEMRS